ncbi:MAG: phosphoribosylanthranilate isomerase [Actinomycetota bacterium]
MKICGITRVCDARVAVRAGANALGFVFAPSPRRVSASVARAVARHVHPSVRKIGVFVDAPPERILDIVKEVGLDGVQLQGDEPPEVLRVLRKALPRLFLARVLRPNDPEALRMATEAMEAAADVIVFDPKDSRAPAIPSEPIPVAWLEEACRLRVVVAGGLTPRNVGHLVRIVRPWGVDTSSGVEAEPGKKDPGKVRAFVRAVRRAEAADASPPSCERSRL